MTAARGPAAQGHGQFALLGERRFGPFLWTQTPPEGRITDTGELYPFRNGIRRIVEVNRMGGRP